MSIYLDIYFRSSFCSLLFEMEKIKASSIIKLDWDRCLTMKLTNCLLCVAPLDFFTRVTDGNSKRPLILRKNCQAQPQLQLNLRLRLVLFLE